MKKTLFGLVITAASIMGARSVAVVAAPPDADKVPLTIRGCVVPGERPDSYLLTDVEVSGPAAPANAWYRFNTTSGLASQVGKRVEVRGFADLDDPDKGKVKVKEDDGKTKTRVETEGKKIRAEQNVTFGTMGAATVKTDIVSYKFNVEHVQTVPGATCPPVKK